YCFGIVDLDEGTRISAQIKGVDELKYGEAIKVGMPLKVEFEMYKETIDTHKGQEEVDRAHVTFVPK
ncbi:unnamed protein product, partial [marine sediment metagenome]